jgi:hypothetical protein
MPFFLLSLIFDCIVNVFIGRLLVLCYDSYLFVFFFILLLIILTHSAYTDIPFQLYFSFISYFHFLLLKLKHKERLGFFK